MELALWVGPAIVAAVIAALINVAGWFITFRQTREIEKDRRSEKVVDTQTALLAEIRSDLKILEDIDFTAEFSATRLKLTSTVAIDAYTPFVPKDSGTPIFSAIVREIAVLPTDVIDPIVLRYKLRESIAHFTEDLRVQSFSELSSDRKLAMMEDYFRMKAHSANLARNAVAALERSLGLSSKVNSTV